MSDKAHLGGRSGAAPATKGGRVKRHCLKLWWLYLLIFIAIVILVVCLIIFVAVAKIAQQRVDGATLSIESIVVSQTQSENYTMSINSTIHADDSVHATIAGFTGVMYLEDWEPQTPFANVTFPETTSAPTTVVNLTQFTPIVDLNAFTVFNTWLLVNDTLNVTVKGDTHVTVKGISRKYPVTFKHTINMPGLSNFNGTTTSNTSIQIQPDANGDNFFGTVTIPNRSLLTFEIGNTSFINFFNNSDIGTVYVDNMILRPGLNNFSMHANISQTPVLTALGQEPYCTDGGALPMLLQGKNVTNHGQHLSYYAESLGATNQSVTIPVGADLKAIGIDILCSNSTS